MINIKVIKNKNFRIQGKKFLLTFVYQCKYTLSSILEKILLTERLVEFVLITRGFHNSGHISYYKNFYYKVILIYKREKNIRSFRRFNYIFNKQGSCEKIYHRNLVETIKHCRRNKINVF